MAVTSVNSPSDIYYVPEQSKLPIFASMGLASSVIGLALILNGHSAGTIVLMCGFTVFAFVLWCWFQAVITENLAGLNNDQLKSSYVWGMGWFIFSEVMFFAAFFGTLFYVRNFAVPWLAGDGTHDNFTNSILWPGFEHTWPLMQTPDSAVNGDTAAMQGPDQNMGLSSAGSIWGWLPFWNTVVLLTSSITVHMAHTALKFGHRKPFYLWLGATVVLGVVFLILQAEEYIEAYHHMGLTLSSGIYGATFFMLTGFHGAHVFLGTFMLLVMFLRATLKNHFDANNCFGFEAASWYWHFVDVVWLCLFIFVYVLA